MKRSQRWLSISFDLILFAGLVAVWIAFAPVKVGGQASYVMVNGISMEPNYHTGDLVIVRKAEAYQVGDVVAYHDGEMGAFVIHRIIGIEQGQFILKGDNNSWIDAYHPTHDEVVGKQWIYTPKAGRAMLWLRTPINLSLTIVLLGGVLMTNIKTKSSRGKKGKKSPTLSSGGGMLEGALYLLGFLFLGFLGLSIFAFTRPITRNADNISYQQDGNYFYSATGTPGVYDTEMVRSGEPVFPKLTCFLNIGFTYTILGNQLQDISGDHQMYARVMDEQSGWLRTIPIIPQTTFSGNSYFSMAALDLCQVVSLLDLVEKETGLHANTYTIEIVTDVAFAANVSGQSITDSFNPTLAFKFDKVHLYLANTNAEIDPMHLTKKGLVSNANLQANTLPLLGWEPTVGFIRVIALLGMGMSLGGLGIMGWSLFNTARQSEEALIRLRYGSMLMDVYERSLDVTLPVIDVTSIDDLAKMAERQNTMILHMTLNFLHYYLVQGNGALYRYVFSAGKRGVSEKGSDRQEVIEYFANNEEYVDSNLQPLQAEVIRSVINPGSPSVRMAYPRADGNTKEDKNLRISVPIQLVTFGLFALIVVSVATAFAAGISTPPSNVGQEAVPVTAEDIKPATCSGMTLTQIVSGSGTLTGTSGNDLIIGSSGADIIDGLGGDDCILGGGGDDSLAGSDGTDVCLGGPGSDTFINCEVEAQ